MLRTKNFLLKVFFYQLCFGSVPMYYADLDPYFSPRESSSGVGRGNLMKTTTYHQYLF